MPWLTRFALRNPVAVSILAAITCIAGILSAFQLKEELMPDISVPVLSITTTYPGASPRQVAADVTSPLEQALRGVPGVDSISSTSLANVSQIELALNMDADLTAVEAKVRERLDQVRLPDNAGHPNVQSFSFNSQPVLEYAVVAGKMGDGAPKRFVNDTLLPALQGVSGVANASAMGADPDVIRIAFRPADLAKYHLSEEQVLQAVTAAETDLPAGSATIDGKVQPVQVATQLHSLADVRNLPIPLPANPAAALSAALSSEADAVRRTGQAVAILAAENKLVRQLLAVQGQRLGAEIALAEAEGSPAGPQDPQAIAKLRQQVAALRQAEAQIGAQLDRLSAETADLGGAAGGRAGSHGTRATASGTPDGAPSAPRFIRLADVADVTIGPPPQASINRTDGRPSILVTVTKAEDANTVDVARAVQAKVAQLVRGVHGVQVLPLFDASQMIQASVHGLLREAALGAVFAVMVILLFLRHGLTTLIAVVSIPLSILTSLILIHRLGITLNIMTLGGLAVATGRVVDDSIVVIENIYRTWRRGEGGGQELVLRATHEVGTAIISSTLTTVAVFLPLGLVSGMVGKIFFPFAITVVCALLSSLLVALTVVPMLAVWLMVGRGPRGSQVEPQTTLRPWAIRYQRALAWCLDHKAAVLAIAAVALVASIAVLPLVGSTFLPNSAERFAVISVRLPAGTPLAETERLARQVEQAAVAAHGVTLVNTAVGQGVNRFNMLAATNQATVSVRLDDRTDPSVYAARLRQRLQPLTKGGADIQVRTMATGGADTNLDWVVTGDNPDAVRQAADRVVTRLRTVPGLANVASNLSQTQPQIEVVPDLSAAARHQLTAQQIYLAVRDAVAAQDVASLTIRGSAYDVVVLPPPDGPSRLASLRDLTLQAPDGTTVRLADVARVSSLPTPTSVLHLDGEPYAEVTADYTVADTARVARVAIAAIHRLALPPGVHVGPSAANQQQRDSFRQLVEAILVAAAMVYFVMLLSFGEWSAPFAILFAMPVALIGAFFGTVLARQPVSVSSLIGILMLMGIVVTNAIVLVSRVEQLRQRGLGVRQALLEASTVRLRPILMTAIATICALLPLAFGASEGVLISQGLAVVVIGGLVSSTVLTLCIVPVMYELLHRRARREEARAGALAVN
ncbi:multidrug transporter AcrB [Alicyclobacillus cellulosilyticus]|uniref:Multidrug transporter AcrB n=1 Tax=Alicyclobacillus cellulosilyticus TaxID=1003997 RepID=A0A917K4J9_9BACL|nr:efflux RND transporter permease subunit [Alicyclobacillus cellulosilyticus]GGI98670.1 multidrug transporter AcrB [Alicyclobacillus cellulosilyticus]